MPRPPAQRRRHPLAPGERGVLQPRPGQRVRRRAAERSPGRRSRALHPPGFPPPPSFATKLRGWVAPAGRMRPPVRKGGQATSCSLSGMSRPPPLPGASRSRRLGPEQRTPPSPPAAPAGQRRGTRATGGMLGCSLPPSRPHPGPRGPGPPRRVPLAPGQLGVLIRAGDGGGSRGAGGKAPETRSAGSGARANSGEDASALSLLCISSARKANSSAEGLNQAFI